MNILEYFNSLIGKRVVFTLPQEDAIGGILVDFAEGFFLVQSEDETTYVALNQSLILMVSEFISPTVATTEEDSDAFITNPTIISEPITAITGSRIINPDRTNEHGPHEGSFGG